MTQFHPHSLVESADVGEGTRVWAFAHIMEGAKVGVQCNVGEHAFIESGAVLGDRVTVKNGCLIWHGVHVGDDVFLGPGVVFTNDLWPRAARNSRPEEWLTTEVRQGASLGANATVLCGLVIGRHALIGAGAVVTKSVRAHALVTGNPAREVGWVCSCGALLDDTLVCSECEVTYELAEDGLVSGRSA